LTSWKILKFSNVTPNLPYKNFQFQATLEVGAG